MPRDKTYNWLFANLSVMWGNNTGSCFENWTEQMSEITANVQRKTSQRPSQSLKFYCLTPLFWL